MIYEYRVKFGGKYYAPGEDVPIDDVVKVVELKKPAETAKEEKPTEKKATKGKK